MATNQLQGFAAAAVLHRYRPRLAPRAPLQVNFAWSAVDAATGAAWQALTGSNSARKDMIIPGPVPARHGTRHNLTLTASIEGAGAGLAASIQVGVTALGSPLVAAVKGPSDFKRVATVVISAAGSYDPDGGAGQARISSKGRGRGR